MQPDIYEIISPPIDLAPFIRRYMYAEISEELETKIRKAPTGFCYFGHVFNGDAWCVLDGREARFPSGFHFSGQVDDRDFYVCHRGTFGHIMAELAPTGAYRLFGKKGPDVVYTCEDLSNVLSPPHSALIVDNLSSCKTKAERLDGFNAALREIAVFAKPEVADVEHAIALIEQSRGCIPVSDLCSQLGVTERTLSRKFRETVGLSPKFFARIVQFNTAVALMFADNDAALTELAHECGYYDQAHFINAMKQFMKLCPREYQQGEFHMVSTFIGRSRSTASVDLPNVKGEQEHR